VAVFAGAAALAFTTWVNWRREGRFTLHVFDPDWWANGRSDAQPYVAGAQTAASKAWQSVWGEGGMIEQAETWLDGLRRDDEPAAGAGAAAAPAGTAPARPAAQRSPEARRLEGRFTAAEQEFRTGLTAYKRAAVGSSSARAAARAEAIVHFARCRDALLASIDPYRALPDHDRKRLADAEELGRMNQRFLHDAQKDSGGL